MDLLQTLKNCLTDIEKELYKGNDIIIKKTKNGFKIQSKQVKELT